MTTNDLDAIEARANAAGVFDNQKDLLNVFKATEATIAGAVQAALIEFQDVTLKTATAELKDDNAALCAEVRELRADALILNDDLKAARAEEAHLRAALERARALAERMPHDSWCATVLDGGNVACDCIKGQLAAALGEGGRP